MTQLNKILTKIIRDSSGKTKLISAIIGLSIAILLLLISIQLQINFNHLLNNKSNRDSIANFLVINKEMTDATLGKTQLGDSIIKVIQSQPYIESVGLLSPSRFKASIESNSDLFPFYTDISFESISADFIDLNGTNWTWNEQSPFVPIIIPTLFLDFYNFQFSLSQNLPQLTPAIVKMVLFKITIYGKNGSKSFNGKIVGFSDRISSMIVPNEFMKWGNDLFASDTNKLVSRLVIRTKDPGNPALTKFLHENQLITDSDKTRFSKYRKVVDVVVRIAGIIGIVLFLFSLLVFTLFIQITIANSKGEIKRLIVLGASPKQLSRFLMGKFFPIYCWIVFGALLVVLVVQFTLQANLAKQYIDLNFWVSPITAFAAFLLLGIIWWVNYLTIKRHIQQ